MTDSRDTLLKEARDALAFFGAGGKRTDALLARIDAALAQGAGAGWKLVPILPTSAMQKAHEDALHQRLSFGSVYHELLAAAPQPERGVPGDEARELLRDLREFVFHGMIDHDYKMLKRIDALVGAEPRAAPPTSNLPPSVFEKLKQDVENTEYWLKKVTQQRNDALDEITRLKAERTAGKVPQATPAGNDGNPRPNESSKP